MKQTQLEAIKETLPQLEEAYGELAKEELFNFAKIVHGAIDKYFNTSIPQVYMRIPKVLNFDEGVDPQQDPAKTIPQELPKEGTDVDTSKSQWYLEIPKAITAIQWTGNNQQAMEEFCNNGRYRISDNGDGTLRLSDSERAQVINQGDYVASLKSGFSVYKAEDFVKEYQFIEKNSDAQPTGFEQQAAPEGQETLPPPPPEDAMTATFSIPGIDLPGKALGKIKQINNKLNKNNWIEKFQSNNVHDTGKQMMKALPGQEDFDNILEQNFGIVKKAVDTATNVGLSIGNNMFNSIAQKGMNKATQPKPAQFNDINEIGCPDTLDGITAIVIKKQCREWEPRLDTGKGPTINQEIDNILSNALSGDLTKTPGISESKEEEKMTEIFGI